MPLTADDLGAMVCFARVADAQSFTEAARQLGLAKSVVSARITGLEKKVGVRLLQRSTRKVSLTPEGERMYERCRAVVAALNEANGSLDTDYGEPHGVLRVSAPETFNDAVLACAAIEFVKRHPAVQIEITASNERVNLVGERVDLAIRLAPRVLGASLVARRIGMTTKIVCASPSYVAEYGAPLSVADLPSHACLRFSVLTQTAEWAFAPPHGVLEGRLTTPLASDSPEALRQAAVAGLGLAVFTRYQVAADLAAGHLVTVLDDAPMVGLGIFTVHTHAGFVPRKISAFVTHLASALATPQWRALAGAPPG
jgi:DNA-binding transcriptional LysR family regulator